jgi:hydrogenase-4 membrane subunit HyfE
MIGVNAGFGEFITNFSSNEVKGVNPEAVNLYSKKLFLDIFDGLISSMSAILTLSALSAIPVELNGTQGISKKLRESFSERVL